jgi:K(+)-stimulated pyrophosphate-energized sodium pump
MDLAEHLVYLAPFSALAALLFAALRARWVVKREAGGAAMTDVAARIRAGSMAFVRAEHRYLAVFALLTVGLLALLHLTAHRSAAWIALSFAAGGAASALSGWLGLRASTRANVRTAHAAAQGSSQALAVAFAGGSAIGLGATGLALAALAASWLGLTELVFAEGTLFSRASLSVDALGGFVLGASTIALFSRVGGGIYATAANASVRGEHAGLRGDDPRSPALIAERVADNVGDVAGMSADMVESLVGAVVAAMVLGLGFTASEGGHVGPVVLPLILAGLGALSSISGSLFVRAKEGRSPQRALDAGGFGASLLLGMLTVAAVWLAWPERGTRAVAFGSSEPVVWFEVAIAACIGVAVGVGLSLVASYFGEKRPSTVAGFGAAVPSLVVPVLLIGLGAVFSAYFAGLYGVAVAALGMLGTSGIQLALSVCAPIAENAGGIARLSDQPELVRAHAGAIDAGEVRAIGRSVAIGSAAMTALALGAAFAQRAGLDALDVSSPRVMAGILVGGLLPFVFLGVAMRAASEAASDLGEEVRRQLREIKGLLDGAAPADAARCVDVATRAALRRTILPGGLAVLVPVTFGFALGAEALGGLLVGIIVCGVLLAMFLSAARRAWDVAMTSLDRAGATGPFDDGVGLHVLVKLVCVVALIVAPFLA